MKNGYTSQIAAIQEFRHHILPIVFLYLTIDNFEHTGGRVDCYDRKARERFLDFGGYGANATAVIKDHRREIRGQCLRRLSGIGG